MIEMYARPMFERILILPVIRSISKINFTPNILTIMACITGLFVIPATAYGFTNSVVALILISGYLDVLDGAFARHKNIASNFGAVLDITCDRVVETAIIFALFLQDMSGRSIYCLLMLAAILLCVTSFLVVAVNSRNNSNKSFYYSPGLVERAEAFIFFILMFGFPGYFRQLAILFTVLVLYTTVTRLVLFYKISTHKA